MLVMVIADVGDSDIFNTEPWMPTIGQTPAECGLIFSSFVVLPDENQLQT